MCDRGTGAEAFVDREEELALLGDQLRNAEGRRPACVVVDGPTGIGKTALIRRFLGLAGPVAVLEAAGAEAEAALAGGIVDQLLRQLPGTGAGDRRDRDPLALGAALLKAVVSRQSRDPLVVLLDDAQWADRVSLIAMGFVLRRLATERVMMIFVCRGLELLSDSIGRHLASGRGVRLTLGGLHADGLARLASAGHHRLAPEALNRLWVYTEGNPAMAVALLNEVAPGGLDAGECPLPAPRSLADDVSRRIGQCPPAARHLVGAAAVLGTRSSLRMAAHLAEIPAPLQALEDAAGAGLLATAIEPATAEVWFPHPLVRSAVYHGLGPAERAELHRAASGVVSCPIERLHHRALAAVGPDAPLARDLRTHAGALAATGQWSAAGRALANAARVAPDLEAATELRLLAMELFLLADGDLPVRLRAHLPAVPATAPRRLVDGLVALTAGRPDRAEPLLRAAVAEGAERALVHLADARFRLGHWDAALADLARVERAAAPMGAPDPTGPSGARVEAMILAARGEWDAAEARLAASRRAVPPADLAVAEAFLAYCRHDFAGVVLTLERLHETDARRPATVVWEDILVDALTALGRLGAAAGALARFERRSTHLGPPALGAAARARGNLAAASGDCGAAEEAFVAALEHLGQSTQPFDTARARLVYGSFLRRSASRRRAAEQLSDALAGFECLGAVPFEERCRHELEACGLTPAKRRAGGRLRLTPREMTVARLAANGRTNVQIASILVVNLKTVEYHLSNVYGKLGLSGRAGLAAKLRDLPDAGSQPGLPTTA